MINVKRFAALLAAACLMLLVVGCAGKKATMKWDPGYSVNVAQVPAEWPREADWPKEPIAKAAWEQVYSQYGKPDYMRRIYTFDNRIIRADDVAERHVMIGKRPVPLLQWLYLDKDLAITFNGPAWEEGEITDQVRTVATHGDPNDIKRFPVDGIDRTSFYYWNHGKEFVFVDGVLTETRLIGAAVPGAVKIR